MRDVWNSSSVKAKGLAKEESQFGSFVSCQDLSFDEFSDPGVRELNGREGARKLALFAEKK